MSRRGYRGSLAAPRDDERQSIGDTHVVNAITALNSTARKTAALMASYKHSVHATLPMIFSDDTLEKLRQVKGMIDTRTDIKMYRVADDVDLCINFDSAGAKVPAIEATALQLQPTRMAPLLTYIAAVKAVHDRFEEVKAVLRWLNRNATPGAVRYFFPQALKLCPQSPSLAELQHVPTRYTPPPRIGDWSHSLKDAAVTVAGSAMLPSDIQEPAAGPMWLKFAKRDVHLTLDSHYGTDEMIYHL